MGEGVEWLVLMKFRIPMPKTTKMLLLGKAQMLAPERNPKQAGLTVQVQPSKRAEMKVRRQNPFSVVTEQGFSDCEIHLCETVIH